MSQRYFVKTFGCQMNVYDSERIGELLEASDMVAAKTSEDADVVILNTCHIREKAAEKVYSDIGRLKASKRKSGVKPVIVVAGCVAQAEGAEIARRAPTVDVVVGPQAYHRLPALLAAAQGGKAAVDTDMPLDPKFDALPARRRAVPPSAFLTVQEGCDKFCTFCVVPYTRGAEVSRPVADLIAEARSLVASGAREIVLLGQNVNAFHGTGGTGNAITLAGLIRELAALPGLARLRYMTSHPRDMDDALIAAHAEVPELMPYLHLPVQSGSTRILKAMNRAHTVDSYLATLDRLRAVRPDIALSGDFIVGFPGETDQDFADTVALVKRVGYAQAYSFKYSPRAGTPAATMENQVPEAVMEARLAELQEAISAGALAFNRASVGKQVDVLLERKGRRPGQLIGKSPWLQSVHVAAGDAVIGDIVRVELRDAQPNSLEGVVLAHARAA
ncbi:tRNA (N6-isopentenyl adenosine(37)-C2)-methylthiotransferase MiaB [Polymorphobacter arshaanensis]|nr:tRNA (N6-isopentenyl adenosine(37)-C2)-methylthiotransferase MiaB [Polymorphobacter arshaanensis]